jgi:hypothetical protein
VGRPKVKEPSANNNGECRLVESDRVTDGRNAVRTDGVASCRVCVLRGTLYESSATAKQRRRVSSTIDAETMISSLL